MCLHSCASCGDPFEHATRCTGEDFNLILCRGCQLDGYVIGMCSKCREVEVLEPVEHGEPTHCYDCTLILSVRDLKYERLTVSGWAD